MKLLALNSGGIDSPVAMHLMLRHGVEMEAVTFDLAPFTEPEDVETAEKTVRRLEEVHGTDIDTHILPHGFVQETFLDAADEDEVRYNCLFSRRVMLRTAEEVAGDIGADALVTGESLGQVASQTLANIIVTADAVDIPVYRPVIGRNKTEIVDIAKEIGTYDISTQGGVSCAAHVDYPETRGVIEEIRGIEERFDVDALVKRGVEEPRA